MAKFYVNEVHDRILTNGLSYGQSIIGLFKQCSTEGRGNFCGYYGSEYYLNTVMYAYYVADCKGRYCPEARISPITISPYGIEYDEVAIGSHMWTNVIEADAVESAVELFKNARWRRWESPFDEPGMIPISSCPRCGQKPSIYHQGGPNIDGLITHFECEECRIHVQSTEDTLKTALKWNNIVSKLKEKK